MVNINKKNNRKDKALVSIVNEKVGKKDFFKRRKDLVEMEPGIVLDIKNLNVSFKKNRKIIHIIRGIDLKIRKGEIIGLVGESGSGKSVTTKALLNINQNAITAADKAHATGYDLQSLKNFNEIRGSKIGYIPQDPMTALNPTRLIGKQINDVLLEHRKEMKTQEERNNYMISILERFGILDSKNKLNQYPHSFSGGMRQRVVITMVVAANPDIIIADEPTTALDPTVQASVLELLEQIRNDFKISIIFISHNIAVVSKFVDFIYVMYAGRIVEKGTKKEIFTNPKHPYTWALIGSLPEEGNKKELQTIEGNPPNLEYLPSGDPFAPRNKFALMIDYKKEPPLFKITDTHYAATWLLHPGVKKSKPTKELQNRISKFKKVFNG